MRFFIEKSSKWRFFGIKIVNIIVFCAIVVNMTTLIGPKWPHKQIKHISTAYFEGQRSHGYAKESLRLSEPDR